MRTRRKERKMKTNILRATFHHYHELHHVKH